jgi:hypothetical protein
MATATKPKMMVARDAVVVVVGASPIEYEKRIVRDRHTGKLAEIDAHELPPVKEAVEGVSYVFARGELVEADHPAVLDCPGMFREPNEFDASGERRH